jgi:hypothetical protein
LEWRITGDLDVSWFNDDNEQHTYRVGLQKRIWEGVYFGPTFLHDNSVRTAPEYYTPQDLRQYSGLLTVKIPFGLRSERTGLPPG